MCLAQLCLNISGLAFQNYETGFFFCRVVVESITREKWERKKTWIFGQETGRDEDTRKYYTDKMKLCEQAYAPDKRNHVGFNNEMLMCMDNVELFFYAGESAAWKRD